MESMYVVCSRRRIGPRRANGQRDLWDSPISLAFGEESMGPAARCATRGHPMNRRNAVFGVLALAGVCVVLVAGGTGLLTRATAADLNSHSGVLQMIDQKIGTGVRAEAGQTVTVHYTGWLEDKNATDEKGKKFDSSRDRNQPFSFSLGAGQVIKGWDEGVVGMKVGGERTLIIPPELGYGSRGAGGVIPPNATLIFEIQLLSVD